MKNTFFYLIIIAVVAFLQSCKHSPVLETCEDLPPSPTPAGMYDCIAPTYNYVAASFNPNNANEIAYCRIGATGNDLCVYNLQTHQMKVLGKGLLAIDAGMPEWGSNDWIFFMFGDMKIWKIKSSGDSLTQTNISLCLYPKLNTALQKMIYYHTQLTPVFSGNIFISTENGTVLDSIPGTMDLAAWQNSENIALFSESGSQTSMGTIQVINPSTKARTNVGTYNFNGNSKMGICWIDNHTLIYMMQDGIYKIDVPTQKTTQLRATCQTNYYCHPAYSPTLHKIVACKTTQKVVGFNLLEVVRTLCLLDVNGNEESEIFIPE